MRAQLREIFFFLDPSIVMLISLSLGVFTLFLIVPLAALMLAPLRTVSMEVVESLMRTPYIYLPPLGDWYTVAQRGEQTLITLRFKNFGVIPNTVLIATIVTVLATLIGTTVALVASRYDFFGKDLLRIVSIVPLLYTPFVNGFVLYKIFGDNGVLASLLLELGSPYAIAVEGIAGVIVTQTIMFWPIVYLNAMASMMQIDPSLEEQAENVGASGLKLFRTITIPLSLPGVAAGAGLTFIFSIEDLAAPLAFKVKDVMSRKIVEEIVGSYDVESLGPEVAVTAGLMLITALGWFVLVRHYVSLRQYAMLSRGGRWKPRSLKPGPLTAALIYLILFPLAFFSVLPQLGVFVYAFSTSWNHIIPEGITLEHFYNVLNDSNVNRGLRNSVLYAAAALAVVILVSTTISYTVARLNIRGLFLLDALAMSPLAIPGLSIALGLLILYGSYLKGTPLDPYQNPMYLLVFAYAVRKSPFATRSIYAGIQQVHKALEEAGMNLGASRTRVIFTILLPLIGLNVMAGSLLTFVYSISEVSTSITIGSLNKEQSPITYVLYDYLTGGYGGGDFIHRAAAIVALLILVQLIAIAASTYILRFRYSFLGV